MHQSAGVLGYGKHQQTSVLLAIQPATHNTVEDNKAGLMGQTPQIFQA